MARSLLEGAGFGADNPPSVHFWYPSDVSRPYMPDPPGLHQAITQMWEDIGFQVQADTATWGDDYLGNGASAGEFEAHFLGWTGDWDDPADWYGYHFGLIDGEANPQFAFNPEGFGDLLANATGALDPAERGAAWHEAAKLVHNQLAFIPVVHADTAVAVTSAVQGYEPQPVGTESMAGIWLSQ
jgi:peptide/nickel transport system substrate-binding protein